MEKLLVAVFDNESKTQQGIQILKKLDEDGSITIHEAARFRKNADGSIMIPQSTLSEFPIQNLMGTPVGRLIAILAGPAGYTIESGAGGSLGLASDPIAGTVDQEFLNEISQKLQPGTNAIVLDMSEEWVTPLDVALEPLTSIVFRRPKVEVEDELISKRITANEKEIENLEKEVANSREDQKTKLESKLNDLKIRINRQFAHLETRKNQIQGETKAKIVSLQQKVSSSAPEVKNKLVARLEALEKADLELTERIKSSIGEKLHQMANRFQRKSG